MSYRIHYLCASHIGNCRRVNQDNFLYENHCLPVNNDERLVIKEGSVAADNSLFGVFDGMGGEEHGEIAAYIAAKEAVSMGFNDGSRSPENSAEAKKMLKDYCVKANDRICGFQYENNVSSMGTTAAILLFGNDRISLLNIGDSRIYRFGRGAIEQLSDDHVIKVPDAKKYPLSQNLGIPKQEMKLEPKVTSVGYRNDDMFLMCSDGLTDMLSDDEIAMILECPAMREAGAKLMSTALARGGKDNITFVMCYVEKCESVPVSIGKALNSALRCMLL